MAESSIFDRFHANIQKWIWKQKWSGLREIQELTAKAIFDTDDDLVISAPTAGGKTEAAFLPILSSLLDNEGASNSFRILAISPLKALINDQYTRLESLAGASGIPVHPWHGDISADRKRKARAKPNGILLITPESLEALFILHGNSILGLFKNLEFIVVDELHAFIASERGIQLQSLMHRIEDQIGRDVRRIGLSATLGNIELATEALRPFGNRSVQAIVGSNEGGAELQLQIRGYERVPMKQTNNNLEEKSKNRIQIEEKVDEDITSHMFKVLRGTTNLIFAGSRANVETYADRLRIKSEAIHVPNEFLPHHGSLSKELRHDVEEKLKSGTKPFSAVCTTTLELGIDIGDVGSVAQIGAPTSIASLKQKLGRSGRRLGKPAILRIYTKETRLDGKTPLLDRLRIDTIMAIASVDLLLEGWCEPPRHRSLHLSTFLHQILSVITSKGGIKAAPLYRLLSETGPFRNITQTMFVILLRHISSTEIALIEQAPDGTLMLGKLGEQMVEHYSYYAVFQTPEEFRIETKGKTLGTIPIDNPLAPGMTLIFAGRRWTLLEVREKDKLLIVKPGSSGVPAKFGGEGGMIHDKIVERMRKIYANEDRFPYLNAIANKHLDEGRQSFEDANLHGKNQFSEEKHIYLFPWIGSISLATLQLAIASYGIETSIESMIVLRCNANAERLTSILLEISENQNPSALELASSAKNKFRNKFDHLLEPELLVEDFAADRIIISNLAKNAKRCAA